MTTQTEILNTPYPEQYPNVKQRIPIMDPNAQTYIATLWRAFVVKSTEDKPLSDFLRYIVYALEFAGELDSNAKLDCCVDVYQQTDNGRGRL